MPEKSALPAKARHALRKKDEARSFLKVLKKRLIKDFEIETQDFALLCLIASANGIETWPPQPIEDDKDARFLTFH